MPLTRGGFRHYDDDRMVVWKWHAQSSSPAMDDLDGIHYHFACAYLLRYAQESGPFPVFTETNQRPVFIISGSKWGTILVIAVICDVTVNGVGWRSGV